MSDQRNLRIRGIYLVWYLVVAVGVATVVSLIVTDQLGITREGLPHGSYAAFFNGV
ncbi:hypothetical protein [Sphingomonas sp.]|uniref:hypothetical protein n=1 Tax=Sphingomonas sp. TaxID=28214 RepID=UPI0028B0EA91|nr:hypothetical protein [Sphingomonas sp.]